MVGGGGGGVGGGGGGAAHPVCSFSDRAAILPGQGC